MISSLKEHDGTNHCSKTNTTEEMDPWKHSNAPGKDFKAGNTEDKGEIEIDNE